MNKETNYDVIVVGAGPVGLLLAAELKRADVNVVVLERRSGRIMESRALALHGRTLEIFSLRGISDQFLSKGNKIPLMEYGALDTRIAFQAFETQFPFVLFLRQTITEEILENHATKLGVPILHDCEVTQLTDEGQQISLETQKGKMAARFVVGADGARSFVRHQIDMPFDGFNGTHTASLGDVVLGAPPAGPGVISSVTNKGALMLAPLGDGVHHRLIVMDADHYDIPKDEPLTIEELSKTAMKISGQDFQLKSASWLSRFTDATRLVRSYRKGNVFLAGDAAHIHAPMGGQGLNVGLQDAMNLGWKLASVVKGNAPDSLLDSYHTERHPVGKMLFDNTMAQVALATGFSAPMQSLRETMNKFIAYPDVNRRIAGEISGFDISYGYDTVIVPDMVQLAKGRRVPNVEIRIEDNKNAFLYDYMTTGKWVSISLENNAKTDIPSWLQNKDVVSISGTVVSKSQAFEKVTAVLVRPDGYVEEIKTKK